MVAKRDPFIGFTTDSVTRATLADAARRLDLPADRVFEGMVDDARESLVGIPTPGILVIDVSGAENPIAAVNSLADVCDSGTKVIVIGDVNDVAVYRSLTGMGVRDYLVKPISEPAFAEALERLRTAERKPAEDKAPSPITVLMGARGGVGSSSIALNCAWIAAQERNQRVAFVDMDLHFGSAALALDLEPEHGFREILEDPARIDELFIQRAMIRATDHLYLLSAEEDLSRPAFNGIKSYDVLLSSLQQRFDAVVIDLPRSLVPIYADVLGAATSVGVVVDMTLHALRDSLRLLALAEEKAPGAKTFVLVNEYANPRSGALDRADFERGLERPIDILIPHDAKAFAKGSNKARTLIEAAPKSKAAEVLRTATDHLLGVAPPASAPLWKRMLKGNKK